MPEPPSRFMGIRYEPTGTIVGKLDYLNRTPPLPTELVNHDAFSVEQVSARSDLESLTVDQSGLSDEHRSILQQIYRTR